MTLHKNEIHADELVVRSLLRQQRPEWADLTISPAGAGTDNTMYRLGDQLLMRLPRTRDNAQAVRKEQAWLPRLAPHLPCRIPEPVHEGTPSSAFPLAWSVYRWIDGDEAGPGSVSDWPAFGADLAAIVQSLHSVPLMGATRQDELSFSDHAGITVNRAIELAKSKGKNSVFHSKDLAQEVANAATTQYQKKITKWMRTETTSTLEFKGKYGNIPLGGCVSDN